MVYSFDLFVVHSINVKNSFTPEISYRNQMKRSFLIAITFLISACGTSNKVDSTTAPALSYLADCSGETGDVNAAWGKSIKPSEIYINFLSPCMNNGVGDKIEIATWTTWSTDVASGVGRFGVNTYEPNGAAENYDFYDITITLDTPVNGYFSMIHLSWTINPPTASESYYVAPMSFNEGLLLNGPESDCSQGWRYNDNFPLELCDHGRGVESIQSVLGMNMDGNFGVDTWKVLCRYQIDNDLDEFGFIGRETWLKMFPYQEGLPGRDYNGDGLVTPDEFGE
jgi:hypothetical protein